MSVFKDLKSIAESANSELISQIDSENDGLAKAIADEFNQIETLEKDVFEYNAPMVPVIQKDLNEGAKYIVEFDMLNKYATDGGIDIVTAYNNVCESNNIPSDDMYVYLRGSITECCTRPEAFEPETLRNSLKAMRSLSENGINLLREDVEACLESLFVSKEFKKAVNDEFVAAPNKDKDGAVMEATTKKILNKYFDKAETVADIKWLRKFAGIYYAALTANQNPDKSWFLEFQSKCDGRAKVIKQKEYESKVAAKAEKKNK